MLVGVVGGGAALVVVAFAVLGASLDEPFRIFSKEPLEQFPDAPPYLGVLAHVTWFVWVVAGTAALLAAFVRHQVSRGDRRIRFLIAAAALTGALLLDDFAMLHERAFPKAGLPEELIYALYAAGFVTLLLRFGPQLREGGSPIALAAGTAWAASIGADFLQEHLDIHAHAVEDGAKLVGTALWAAYLCRASVRTLLAPPQVRQGTADAADG